ncbi:MAG: tRNA nucleotidyltransferase [Vicingaceae bacterium]|nr:MAG: tRNA nucleotidyltransferase [Vicingaceae bacterium]
MKIDTTALQLPIIQKVAALAAKNKVDVYIVGGYVRDFLLKRNYKKDIDFMVVGDGPGFAALVASELGIKEVNIFKNFGTAMFHYDGMDIEFVGSRKESYSKNSRKPKVDPGTLEDDLKRRDFTINAMAVSLKEETWGEIVDLFNGLEDLKNKIIRTPLDPNVTFSDDPLRMMRAVRFATQLDFELHPETFQAIKTNKERLKIISRERITDELNKIILSPKPSKGFIYLYQTGLLEIILPELCRLQGVESIDNKMHKDNFYHTLEVLDNISKHTENLWLRWAALLHDIGKAPTKKFEPGHGWTFHGHEEVGARMVPAIFKRLKLPLDQKMRYVEKLVRMHLRPIALVNDNVTDSAVRRLIYDAGDDLDDLMTLCRADVTSKNPVKRKKYSENFDKVIRKIQEVEEKDQIRNFKPVLDGHVIMKIFGLKPGKEIGILKNRLKDAVLDGKIKNEFDQAYDFVVEEAEKQGLKPLLSKEEAGNLILQHNSESSNDS